MISFIRSFDRFGSQVGLKYAGGTQYKTIGGATASAFIMLLSLVYLCTSTAQLIAYEDPDVTSYTKYDDRAKMDHHINMSEYGLNFAIIFVSSDT